MAWIGKVGGGILGLIVGGPVGAVIGSALGHQFDRGAGRPGLLDYEGLADANDGTTYSAADRQRQAMPRARRAVSRVPLPAKNSSASVATTSHCAWLVSWLSSTRR